MGMNELEIYRRVDERWAWRLVAGNGQVIATDGGQGYENKRDCLRIASDLLDGEYRGITITIIEA